MSEIRKIYLIQEFIKNRERLTLPGWKYKKSKLDKFCDKDGRLKNNVIGGKIEVHYTGDDPSDVIEVL